MTRLGLWTPYVNEREMSRWYKLPPELAAEAKAYRPDGREMDPLGKDTHLALVHATVGYVRASVEPFRPPYHNDETHFRAVRLNGMAAMGAYAAGARVEIPVLVRQAFDMALYTHDAHHCGSTLRMHAPHGVYRPDLGVEVSSEYVTAMAVSEFMRTQGMNLPFRLFLTGVTWSSTYGGESSEGRRLHIPNPRPQTIWGAIMRASDACPPESFREWLRQSVAVNYGEVPAEPRLRTLDSFIAGNERFLNYVAHCFDELDRIAGVKVTEMLSWRNRLQNLRRGMAQLSAREPRLVGFVLSEAQRYGVTLDLR